MPATRADPDWPRYLLARVTSVAGSSATLVALPVLVYRLTGSALLTGVISGAESLPYLLFGLIAGTFADRRNRRSMMITADLVSAAVVGSVPLVAAAGVLGGPQVVTVAALLGVLFVFFDAADIGALPTLVGPERIAAANSRLWSLSTATEVIVPALAGAALAALAPATLLGVDALSYLASAALVARITTPLSRPRPAATPGARAVLADAMAGVRYLWAHREVRAVTAVGAAQAFSGGAMFGQTVVWADRALGVHARDPWLGVLFSAWGLGTLVASLAMPRLTRRFGAARLAISTLPLSGLLAVATALAPEKVSAAALTVVWAGAYMLVVVTAVTFRQQVTPEPLQSRVSVLGRMLSWGVGAPVGALLAGVLTDTIGVRPSLVCCGLVTVAAGVAGWRSPLRRDRPARADRR